MSCSMLNSFLLVLVVFKVKYLGFSPYKVVISVDREHLILSFPIWMAFLFLSLTFMVKCRNIFSRRTPSAHPVWLFMEEFLACNYKWWLLLWFCYLGPIWYPVLFSLYQIYGEHLLPWILLKFFLHLLKSHTLKYHFVNVIYHIYWLAYAETILTSQGWIQLDHERCFECVTEYGLLVEKFYICVHHEYWLVFFSSFWI